jgi:hypothetical protein
MLSSIFIALFWANNLMKPRGSIWVVRRGRSLCANPRVCNPQVREMANGLRLRTAVLSQDLSGTWVTVRG